MPLFQSSLLLAYKDHCLGFLCTQSRGRKGNSCLEFYHSGNTSKSVGTNISSCTKTHTKKTQTTTGKLSPQIKRDAKVISMWYCEPLGILVLHLSHVCSSEDAPAEATGTALSVWRWKLPPPNSHEPWTSSTCSSLPSCLFPAAQPANPRVHQQKSQQ